jgi:hypothetical protein
MATIYREEVLRVNIGTTDLHTAFSEIHSCNTLHFIQYYKFSEYNTLLTLLAQKSMGLHHGSGKQLVVSHHKSLGLIPDQYVLELQLTKWHCNRFFSIYFSFTSNHGVIKFLQVNSGIILNLMFSIPKC